MTEYERTDDGTGKVWVWDNDGKPVALFSPDAREWIEAGLATAANPNAKPEPEPQTVQVEPEPVVGAAGQTITEMQDVGPPGGVVDLSEETS